MKKKKNAADGRKWTFHLDSSISTSATQGKNREEKRMAAPRLKCSYTPLRVSFHFGFWHRLSRRTNERTNERPGRGWVGGANRIMDRQWTGRKKHARDLRGSPRREHPHHTRGMLYPISANGRRPAPRSCMAYYPVQGKVCSAAQLPKTTHPSDRALLLRRLQ
jgi:hypothetical protein